jgi:16S rRNA (guanine966-N2)-methyltransferase
MAARKRNTPGRRSPRDLHDAADTPIGLRIIGGAFRGRKLDYTGDRRTRPMKDRVREAIFNLLGPSIAGAHAVDLFAGTGALGLEAVSRGAVRATFIEQHFPTADLLQRNAAALGIERQCEVIAANTFIWARRHRPSGPESWAVFCSPPYDFYLERREEMLDLLRGLIQSAPAGSQFVVEADARFDFGILPSAEAWDIREYSPAVVGILKKPGPPCDTAPGSTSGPPFPS